MKIKHSATIAINIFVMVVLTLVCVTVYRNYKASADKTKFLQASAKAIADEKHNLEVRGFNAELSKLKDNCLKDKLAYASKTTSEKLKTVSPNCNEKLETIN